MRRVPGCRCRMLQFATVVIVFLSGPIQLLPAQWVLTPLWSDVTPGRITVEPWGTMSRPNASEAPDAGIVIATEDRWIRRRNAAGDVAAAARIGLRRSAGVLHEAPHHALLIPDRSGSAPFVRIDHAGGALQTVGHPVAHNAVIPEDARFVAVDGESLIYSVSASGLITHASASSGILWQRRLPVAPTAVAEYRGAVYVALTDGRIFRFDGNGTGIELLRLGAPAVAMRGVATASAKLVVLDRTGAVTLIDIADDQSNGASVRWRTAVSLEEDLGTPFLEVAPPQEPSESWYAVVARPAGGITVVNSEGALLGSSILDGAAIDDVLAERLPSGGFLVVSEAQLILVSASGSVMSHVALRGIPRWTTWISATNQLIVAYADWRIEAWTVAPALDEVQPVRPRWSAPPPPARRAVNAIRSGALTARAEAVLAGTARAERRALIEEIVDQRRRAVLFDRVGEARTILRRLVREPLETAAERRDFPEIRRMAAAELGRYMDRTSRSVLTEVVRYDPDYEVVATALRAFAAYGVDETGITEYAVARFQGADDRGRSVMGSALIELLELTSAARRHPAAIEAALDLLIESNLSRDIRRRAATIARERTR